MTATLPRRFAATLPLACALAGIFSHPSPAQITAHKANPHHVVKPAPAGQAGAPAPSAAVPAKPAASPPGNGPASDPAFAAYQVGHYLAAFALATKNIEATTDPKSMTLLGELYANGLGVPENDAKAAEWYKLAADRGDRQAMFALAIFRLQGRAGQRDREESAKWLAAAAKLGHPLAAYDLALLYMEGQLFPQDFTRAAELLGVSVQAGNADAQYALGTLYKEGRGVARDMHEAVRLWALASLADNTDAEVEYAIALFNGDGVAKNEVVAAELFRRAAIRGSPIAQDRLALILSTGRGVTKNPVEATKWHLISRARGETNLMLDEFVNHLDAETRAAGQQAAKPWLDAIKQIRSESARPISTSAPGK